MPRVQLLQANKVPIQPHDVPYDLFESRFKRKVQLCDKSPTDRSGIRQGVVRRDSDRDFSTTHSCLLFELVIYLHALSILIYKEMVHHVIHFGLSCAPEGAGALGVALARYMFYPQWVFVFSYVLALIDDRTYFVFATFLVYTFLTFYTDFLSGVIEEKVYFCGTERFAVPDSHFVPSMSFTITVAVGFVRDKVSFGWITGFLAWTAPFLYMASTLYTGYFTPWLLFANVCISVCVSGCFILMYYVCNNSL